VGSVSKHQQVHFRCGCDVAKCESCLTTANDAFNSAVDLLSFIDNKRKNLYTEEHIPKPFASDGLEYFQEAQERVKAIYEELQKASNKLTTTLMSLKRKFPWSRMGNNRQSRRKKENKRKVKKKIRRKDSASEHICGEIMFLYFWLSSWKYVPLSLVVSHLFHLLRHAPNKIYCHRQTHIFWTDPTLLVCIHMNVPVSVHRWALLCKQKNKGVAD